MLTDFFRINMPYGIAKNKQDEWMAFNREYLPLGFNDSNNKNSFWINEKSEYPVHTMYKGLSEKMLLSLAENDGGAIKRNDNGEIITVFFYNDRTNPVNQSSDKSEFWMAYFSKIKKLSKLQRK